MDEFSITTRPQWLIIDNWNLVINMLFWLLSAIASYLFFGLASIGDKLVLGQSKSPKLYTFYVGLLNLLVLLLVPFVGFSLPDAVSFFWIILTSFVFMLALYVFYCVVEKFEVSKVVPLIGAVQPIFVLFLSWIFFGSSITKPSNFWAFLILLAASVVISFEKKPEIIKNLLKLSLFASLLIAVSLVLTKVVFLRISFFPGIIWLGIFNFLFVLVFLFNTEFRREFFVKKTAFDKKTLSLVALTQSAGGIAGILQNVAIYLAPVSDLPIINALKGVQYIFLFIITLIFSFLFPKILKEEISKKIIIQKVSATILICVGLAVLISY